MDINELTYSINGAVFEVDRVLGSGFLEKVYENALVSVHPETPILEQSLHPLSGLDPDLLPMVAGRASDAGFSAHFS